MPSYVGFGFGPIQAGLFLDEAFQSGAFDRLVVAEINAELVASIRGANGKYAVNVAARDGIEVHHISRTEIYNPLDIADHRALTQAVAEASEIATALPSVDFYDKGASGVAAILAEGLSLKLQDSRLPRCIVYAAENHNHAAEILTEKVCARMAQDLPPDASASMRAELAARAQFLNTVIGKMSRMVGDSEEIAHSQLSPMIPGADKAFLVEAFNRILISRVSLPGFERRIRAFEEKDDLLPFEEAKLYGHNATHALIGYLAHAKKYRYVSEAAQDAELISLARTAFLEESWPALAFRHAGKDPLFSAEGYRAYALDLLERMANPWLRDAVERVVRDPRRKLDWNDRLIGVMRLALDAGITPRCYALGAVQAFEMLRQETGKSLESLAAELWNEPGVSVESRRAILEMIEKAPHEENKKWVCSA